VAGCCECGDEPSGSCATELVRYPTSNKNDSVRFQVLAAASMKKSLPGCCAVYSSRRLPTFHERLLSPSPSRHDEGSKHF
jgi:hypothetical protein